MDSLSQNQNNDSLVPSTSWEENNEEDAVEGGDEIVAAAATAGTNDNEDENTDTKSTDSSSHNSSNDIFHLLIETDWEGVRNRCQRHPEERNNVHPVSGRTPLHVACAIGSTPYDIIKILATPPHHKNKNNNNKAGVTNSVDNSSINTSVSNDTDNKQSSLLHSLLENKKTTSAASIIMKQEKKYGDTPLHIVCRTSQRTSSKVSLLLSLLANTEEEQQEDKMGAAAAAAILETNVFGGTPLHSACAYNAMFAVIEMIVQFNPLVLKKKTREGISCLQVLYFSYQQSIPGHLAIVMILNATLSNFSDQEGHFQRFWKKVQYLTLEYYKLTRQCPQKFKATIKTKESIILKDSNSSKYEGTLMSDYLVHGLVQFNAPMRLLQVALNLKMPAGLSSSLSWARVDDRDGNLPLHVLVENRPFRGMKERSSIACMVNAYPDAIKHPNNLKQIPLLLAIRNKIPWNSGMKELIQHDQYIVSYLDPQTKLYPFQLAAAVGGRRHDGSILTTIYELLVALPEVITVFL